MCIGERMKKWEAKAATRTPSPGAPATGPCPDGVNCLLGANCPMDHTKPARTRGRAKSKAGAAGE